MKTHKNVRRMIIAGVIGFGISMVIMAVMIYFGYTKAYSTNVAILDVKLFSLPIYTLTNVAGEYIGQSIGSNMGIISTLFIVVGILIERMIYVVKKRR